MILILFTAQISNELMDEVDRLESQGLEVFEALAISEVFALAEQHPACQIVITPEVNQSRTKIVQQHYPTVRLHKQFTPMSVSLN